MENKFKIVFALIVVISLTLVLSSCGFPVYFNHYSVSGTVQDSEGKPIMNAAIKFDNGYSSTSSDEDGYWQKSGLGGSVIIRAEKAGHSFTPSQYPVNENETNINFTSNQVVPEKYEISGKVEDGKGNGIGDIVIRFSDGYAPTTTDSSGNWEKDNLSGDITVTPDHNKYVFDPTSRSVSGPDSYVNFVARESSKTYSISGKVVDQQDNGISDVIIRFSGGFESIKTDEEGNWEKDGLEGEVTITPEKRDYTFDPESRTVSGSDKYLNFVGTYADQPYDISGQVVDNQNNGIEDVVIRCSGSYSPVTTGADGNWEKENLEGEVTVTPEKTDYSFDPASRTVSGPDSYMDFVGTYADQPYDISGQVVDNQDNGIEDVVIRFSGSYSPVTTDADGNWEKENLEGEVTVTPEKTDYSFDPASRTVSGPDSYMNFVGTYADQPYDISGQVVDNQDNGIEDVVIRFSGSYSPVTTDADGNWEKENLEGEVTVTPGKTDYSFDPASRRVSGPDSYMDFVGTYADQPYDISGQVVDNQNNGIEDVVIRFSGSYSPVTTDADGNWEKENLEGEVTVTPEKTDYSFDPASRTVSGPDSYMDFAGTYTNTDYYNVEGYVYLEDSTEGVPGVEITFESMNLDKQYSTVVTDHEGKWSKTNLQGQVKIIPELEGWNITPTEQIITIEDEASSIDFNAYTTSQYEFYGVSGKVIDEDANGLPGIKLTFERNGALIWITFTDEEGSFTVGEYLWGEITIIPDPDSTSDYTFDPEEQVIEQESENVIFQGSLLP